MTDELKQNVTNDVIATKLDGFKELTDTKFKNVEETLKRIEGNNAGFATKTELEEVKKDFNETIKRMEDAQKKHNEDDIVSFGTLQKGQGEIRDIVLGWGKIIAVIVFILPIVVPIALHYIFKW